MVVVVDYGKWLFVLVGSWCWLVGWVEIDDGNVVGYWCVFW